MSRHRKNKEKMREYTNSEIAEIIDEYIHSERDRAILKRRLIDGLTFSELSDEFCLSERRLKAIVYNNGECVFNKIK